MKVRSDVYIGENPRIDISFLKRRSRWLPCTGIYLEFLLKGEYQKQVDFQLESLDDSIVVTRHSWNRFFLNIKDSGSISFRVMVGGKEEITEQHHFAVANVDFPLMFSVLNLFNYSISDVRFFANRLSENLVNSTRVHFFNIKVMEKLAKQNFDPHEDYWKLYDLLFSILTERGIMLYISPFGQKTPYPLEFISSLKPLLLTLIERSSKFRVVWDLSEGLRKKELGGVVDSVVTRFGSDIPLVVRNDMIHMVGGEGFSYQFENVKLQHDFALNDKGVKIARLRENATDFSILRKFVSKAVKNKYGVEYVYYPSTKSLHSMRYSLSRAMYLGYADAMKEN